MKYFYKPNIHKSEFKKRRENLRLLMDKNNIDIVVAYSDDRATFGQQYTRYFFNYQPHFEPACVIIPKEGESCIVTGPECEELVLNNSYCRNVKIADVFTHPDEEYPFHQVLSFSKLLKLLTQFKKNKKITIGLAGSEMLPYKYWKKIKNLEKSKIVEVNEMIEQLRCIKSQQEIKVIQHAYKIAQKGVQKGIEVAQAGITERELAAEIEYEMRKLGSEGMGIDTIVGSGKINTRSIITRATSRKVKNGEHILLTIAPRYEGYHGAIGRVIAIGQINEQIPKFYEVAIKAQNEVIKHLKPGIKGKEIDKIARKVCREHHLEKYFAYSGIHSVGYSEFEPPILTSWNEVIIKKNMVLSIDIPLFFVSWGGLRVEDGFQVLKNSNKPLQTIPKDIVYK
tara:strand:+ start:267 stop:1454 length:1188 start_codon:yes stop_codon:yes gene_type:complete